MRKIYTVIFNRSNYEKKEVEIELFRTFEQANARFKSLIANEMNPKLSWVGSEAFDKYGYIKDGYLLEKHIVDFLYVYEINFDDMWWKVTDANNGERYSHIELRLIDEK